ncbi:MAG TPA: alpha-L-rhamnosidase N-terminal domain-containing protein, partial [Terriglobia bacterium]|nr:alpha-L-rhamnosidase N-terminal domain-containing protein [Terriglobia bacterium]
MIAVEARWFGQGMAWYEEPPVPRDFGARSHGALLCQLDIGEGANRQIVKTEATWKATEDHAWDWNTPQVNNSLASIEVYHSDRVVKGWTQPQFDDSGWTPVEVMRGFWGLTSPPMGPYIHLVPRPLAYPLEKE